ncbi:hypothetical protein EVAR_24704_1 [Eumeta japonica]|uniref:Uncharacterized protein n=1 Tax=Eumeta variegata TaxID=151549 RepID=A0A4C1VEM2_EUMVA|nr:hypothetical protein EVAR_24704_1 [Eumeta japonica]
MVCRNFRPTEVPQPSEESCRTVMCHSWVKAANATMLQIVQIAQSIVDSNSVKQITKWDRSKRVKATCTEVYEDAQRIVKVANSEILRPLG